MTLSILVPSKNEKRIFDTTETINIWFPDAQLIVANDRYGKGKGYAVREAMSIAGGDIIVFIDGDFEIHPRMIERLIPFLQDYDIVVGKKQIRGFLSRRILTHLSRLYIWLMFGLIYDTQTGIKAFRKEAIPDWQSNSFAFDIEILSKAKKNKKTIIEVPVEVNINRKMKLSSIWKCFIESLKIWWKLNVKYR